MRFLRMLLHARQMYRVLTLVVADLQEFYPDFWGKPLLIRNTTIDEVENIVGNVEGAPINVRGKWK